MRSVAGWNYARPDRRGRHDSARILSSVSPSVRHCSDPCDFVNHVCAGSRSSEDQYQKPNTQLQAAYNRAKDLQAAGNIALEIGLMQETERKLQKSQAKVKEETANTSAARAELMGKQSDRQAYIHKAEADVQYYGGALDKTKSEVSKAEKEKFEMESKVSRQSTQKITAPFDGYLVHLSENVGSQMFKKGDPICTIVPETNGRAVQVWLDGNDAPLVAAGRHVRLQFEGWPAVQFAGWPSVAVGTFGGTTGCCWNRCPCGSRSGGSLTVFRPRWMDYRSDRSRIGRSD